MTILLSNQSILECNRRQRDVKASQIGSIFLTKSMYRDDIVKISWHIYLKDITDYAASSKSS